MPLYKPPAAEAVYVTSEQTTNRPVVRDPEHTGILMHTLDSAPKVQTQTSHSRTSSVSEWSYVSGDPLLRTHPPVPASRPNMVYAQINVQQTQVPPPASDDHVQYAQLKHQDKM